MNTEKFTTQEKSNFKKAQNTFVDFSTTYIKNWTNKELTKYRSEPVVIPAGNYRFFIGPFVITGQSKHCWTVNQVDGKHIHDFVTKSNAIVYCLKSMRNKPDYKDILELDRQLGRLDNDIAFYKHTIATSKNQFKNAIVLNRYIDATLQRRSVLNILKKTLISAKYMNFGKLPL
jgi:hypothetical protein